MNLHFRWWNRRSLAPLGMTILKHSLMRTPQTPEEFHASASIRDHGDSCGALVLTSSGSIVPPGGVMARDDSGSSFLWFLAGLGIGAIVGVLYAPKSGTETREAIRRSAEEGRDFMVTRARQAREQANDWVDRGREVLDQQKQSWDSAVKAGKQAYREAATAETTGTKGS